MGKVLKLFYTLDDAAKTRMDVGHVSVDKDGIVEDKFHAKNLQRSVLITSTHSYMLAKQEGIEILYGALGENILIDANPYHLLPTQRLQIGDVTLEITQNCTLCKGLSSVDSKLPKILKNDRGIFAKVLSKSGEIKVGDSVTFYG